MDSTDVRYGRAVYKHRTPVGVRKNVLSIRNLPRGRSQGYCLPRGEFDETSFEASLCCCCTVVVAGAVAAQDGPTILTGTELTRVVPPGFYFQGLSAPTQMRNSA